MTDFDPFETPVTQTDGPVIIPRERKSSSNIASIGYDQNRCLMDIEFRPTSKGSEKKVYRYENVPLDVWKSREDYTSLGSWVHSMIRNKYKYTTFTEAAK